MLWARLREVREGFLEEVLLGLRCEAWVAVNKTERGGRASQGKGTEGVKWHIANKGGLVIFYSKYRERSQRMKQPSRGHTTQSLEAYVKYSALYPKSNGKPSVVFNWGMGHDWNGIFKKNFWLLYGEPTREGLIGRFFLFYLFIFIRSLQSILLYEKKTQMTFLLRSY